MNNLSKPNDEKLLKTILFPVISEKATFISEKNDQAIFLVSLDANKLDVKAAVEMLFNVQVKSVQIARRLGKVKRSAKHFGRRNHTKRAFVCLMPGQQINFSDGVS